MIEDLKSALPPAVKTIVPLFHMLSLHVFIYIDRKKLMFNKKSYPIQESLSSDSVFIDHH
jgi:hypothetical protein